MNRFHHLWLYAAVTALGSGLIGALIPRPAPGGRVAVDQPVRDLVAAGRGRSAGNS